MNCSDIYRYNIDCQWVDISELAPGSYTLKVRVRVWGSFSLLCYIYRCCCFWHINIFSSIYSAREARCNRGGERTYGAINSASAVHVWVLRSSVMRESLCHSVIGAALLMAFLAFPVTISLGNFGQRKVTCHLITRKLFCFLRLLSCQRACALLKPEQEKIKITLPSTTEITCFKSFGIKAKKFSLSRNVSKLAKYILSKVPPLQRFCLYILYKI